MAQVSLVWHGDAEAQRALAGLPDLIEKRVLAQALRKVAKQLLPVIKATTPVGKPFYRMSRQRLRKGVQGPPAMRRRKVTGGRLRSSLKIRALKRSRRRVGVAIVTGTRAELGIKHDGYYPAHLEFGWIPGFTTLGTIPPRRYMKRPAVSNRGALLGTLASEIRAGVEREVKP